MTTPTTAARLIAGARRAGRYGGDSRYYGFSVDLLSTWEVDLLPDTVGGPWWGWTVRGELGYRYRYGRRYQTAEGAAQGMLEAVPGLLREPPESPEERSARLQASADAARAQGQAIRLRRMLRRLRLRR